MARAQKKNGDWVEVELEQAHLIHQRNLLKFEIGVIEIERGEESE